jgi:hypothetical protein
MNPSSIYSDEESERIKVEIKAFTPREGACPKLDHIKSITHHVKFS